MAVTYDVNKHNQVVSTRDGRKNKDASSYRELTGFEEQLLSDIENLKRELEEVIEKYRDLEKTLRESTG